MWLIYFHNNELQLTFACFSDLTVSYLEPTHPQLFNCYLNHMVEDSFHHFYQYETTHI